MNQHNKEWKVFAEFNQTDSAILSIAFNMDGTKIAVGFGKNGYDSRLNIWKYINQDWIFESSVSALNEMPKSLFFFKNDETLIVGAQESAIREFKKSSQNIWENKMIGTHNYNLNCMIYLKEQNKIVTCGGDWQLLSYEFKQNIWYLHQKLNGHKGKINYLCASYDETQIASGGDDKTVLIWVRHYNISNNFYFYEQHQIIDGFEDRVWVLTFSKQEILATGELNGKIRIFVKTGGNIFECIQVMKAHDRYVQALQFNYDDIPILVSGEGYIKIWQLVGEAWRIQQQVMIGYGATTCIAFCKDQKIMAVGQCNQGVKLLKSG